LAKEKKSKKKVTVPVGLQSIIADLQQAERLRADMLRSAMLTQLPVIKEAIMASSNIGEVAKQAMMISRLANKHLEFARQIFESEGIRQIIELQRQAQRTVQQFAEIHSTLNTLAASKISAQLPLLEPRVLSLRTEVGNVVEKLSNYISFLENELEKEKRENKKLLEALTEMRKRLAKEPKYIG
jgi:hypothetical protein